MRWKQAVSRRVILDLCPKLNTGYVAQCGIVLGCEALRRALGIMRSRGSIPATADQEMQVQVLLWPNIFPFLSFLSQFSQMIGTFHKSIILHSMLITQMPSLDDIEGTTSCQTNRTRVNVWVEQEALFGQLQLLFFCVEQNGTHFYSWSFQGQNKEDPFKYNLLPIIQEAYWYISIMPMNTPPSTTHLYRSRKNPSLENIYLVIS